MRNASIIDNSQISLKAFILTAIYLAFGWSQNENGVWEQGTGRDLPEIPEKLSIRPIAIYHRVYLGANKEITLFDQTRAGKSEFITNQESATLGANKLVLFAGMKLRAVAPAAEPADLEKPTDAELDAVVFDDVADSSILAGNISLDISQRKIFDKDNVGILLDNIDGINNYIRFEQMKIQEPTEAITCKLKFPVAPGQFYLEGALLGYELSVAKA